MKEHGSLHLHGDAAKALLKGKKHGDAVSMHIHGRISNVESHDELSTAIGEDQKKHKKPKTHHSVTVTVHKMKPNDDEKNLMGYPTNPPA